MTSIRVAERRRTIPAQPGAWDTGINGTGRTKPAIPTKDNTTNNTTNIVKPANSAIYIQKRIDDLSDLSAEEKLAFMALTGNEILTVARNINMSFSSLSLNRNMLDSVNVVNSISPIEIIRTLEKNTDYLNNSPNNVNGSNIVINQGTGNAVVSLPGEGLPGSKNDSLSPPSNPNNDLGGKLEVIVVEKVNTQDVAPQPKIVSLTPTSQKRGGKITVTHENCNDAPPGSKFLLTGNGKATNTIGLQKPTGTSFVKFKTATNHGIQVGQTVEITGIEPAIYRGTWTAQSGTAGAILALDIRKNGSIKPKEIPPTVTTAGTVSFDAQEIPITSKTFNKSTAKTTFTFLIPAATPLPIIGAQYKLKVVINNVPAISKETITITST